MLIKIHKGYRKTVALSDTDLLNKTFEQDKRQITLHKHFFEGEEKTKNKMKLKVNPLGQLSAPSYFCLSKQITTGRFPHSFLPFIIK